MGTSGTALIPPELIVSLQPSETQVSSFLSLGTFPDSL